MHEFAEEYVANLQPREERFFTRLGDDFYIATFPNGVKTWIFLYEIDGHTRRQTLGVYPEMPMPKALELLCSARRALAVEADLATDGMDQSQIRFTEDSPINLTTRLPALKMPEVSRPFRNGALVGSGATAAIAAVVAWAVIALMPAAKDVPAVKPVAAGITAPQSQPMQARNSSQSDKPANTRQPLRPVPAVDKTAPESTAESLNAMVLAATSTSVESTEPPGKVGEAHRALRKMQEELAGTLAVAQLTTGIEQGAPVDSLGWVIELGEKPLRIFYYVRVRGMAGSRLTYNWKYDGQIVKADTVPVSRGWHSTAFSGFTLTSKRLGQWQVDVMTTDGEILGSESFEARLMNAQTLSSR